MEKVKFCIRGYHTDNKDAKPESNKAVSENGLTTTMKNETDHMRRKEQTKMTKSNKSTKKT